MWRAALVDLGRFQAGAIPWSRALCALLSIGIPSIAGVALHAPVFGVVAAVTALNAFIDDLGGSVGHRVSTMAATVVLVIIGGIAGALVPADHWLPVVAIFCAGLVAGWVHGSAPAVENVVRFGAITLVITTTLKLHDPRLIACAAAGGVLAVIVMLIDHAFRRIDPPPLGGSWTEGWQRLRNRQTAGLRFAVLYAAVATAGLLLAEAIGAHRAGWVTLTTLLVMRPDGAESLQFVVQRLAGTLAGVAVAVLVTNVTQGPAMLVGCVALSASLFPIAAAKHRWLGVAAATLMVILLLDLALAGTGSPRALIIERFYDTVLGCVLGTLGTLAAFPNMLRSARGR